MDEHEKIYLLKIKYLHGEATEDEILELLQWINRSEENKELYFQVKDISDALKAKNYRLKTASTWKKIVKRAKRDAVIKQTPPARARFPSYIKYAAAVLLLALAGYYYFSSSTLSYISISVPRDQVSRKVELPDHSFVWLKPGSAIRYVNSFNKEAERIIKLEGDAFFDVVKVLDKQGQRKTFTIQTSKLNIRVLGTSFNVIDHGVKQEVIVRTGVVRIESNRQVKVLHPGDRLQLTHQQLHTDKINADLYMGWTNGVYKLNNTSILEIKELLEANYACAVIIKQPNDFKNNRLTGRILAPDKSTLLKVLGTMLSASIISSTDGIIIQPFRSSKS